ncbi:MAG TPA: hypothetical protein VNL91_03690 [Thermoanaerobaculia bacterium]|nr:hypothetical protein [Thermoanaerobaculia bacterium]
MANGDPFVLALPTNTATYRWVVLRRTAQGGVVVHPENPFEVEIFQSTAEGSARFDSLPPTLAPALVTTTDGKTLVVRLKHPEGRTAPRR